MAAMKPQQQSTTAFYTLDGCHSGLLLEVFDALVSADRGSSDEWLSMCEHPRIQERFRTQGIDEYDSRSMIQWDDPTILFTLTRMLDQDNLPIMLGKTKTGNDLVDSHIQQDHSSIRSENVRSVASHSNELYEDLVTHLDYLLTRCNSERSVMSATWMEKPD